MVRLTPFTHSTPTTLEGLRFTLIAAVRTAQFAKQAIRRGFLVTAQDSPQWRMQR
jgi:hypothetical protein